jgi:hypothetical protein
MIGSEREVGMSDMDNVGGVYMRDLHAAINTHKKYDVSNHISNQSAS